MNSGIKSQQSGWRKRLKSLSPRDDLRHIRRKSGATVRNAMRKWRKTHVDYVVLPIKGSLPEQSAPPKSFIEKRLPLPPSPLSIQTILYTFRRIAAADNVDGVVLVLGTLNAGTARLYSIRRGMERLQAAGKRVIVWTTTLDTANYYLASGADFAVAPHSTDFDVLGLQIDSTYLKDTLSEIGVHADVIRISPYKSAGNRFVESTMIPEEREQYTWLLEDQWDWLTAEIARGRKLDQAEIKQLIDTAPFSAEDAQKHGLIDAVAYEDELPYLLAEKWPITDKKSGDKRTKAKLVRMSSAGKQLQEVVRKKHKTGIGLVAIEGMITVDPTPNPVPIPGSNNATGASQKIVPLLRRVEKDDEIAALLVYVNSGGGSALASDLMWRQIERIGRKKPVLVMMGDVAASGGYYVSAPGQHIMARPTTITGSIGVISGRISTEELMSKLHVNRVSVKQGEHAGLYRDTKVMTVEERQIFEAGIMRIYHQFKQVVAQGRDLDYDDLDRISLGRVWTGNQAQEHGLVDSMGDYDDAVKKLCQMAGLPHTSDAKTEVPVWNMRNKGGYVLPKAYPEEAEIPVAAGLPANVSSLLTQLNNPLLKLLDGRPLCYLPFDIKIR